jgi:ribosomal protein S18 acetylase RimI-like enzyme
MAGTAGLRLAQTTDLGELLRLETTSFEDWRQDSRRVIRGSLANPRHEVWVLPDPEGARLLASLYLRHRPGYLWVYSIATDPAARGAGLGGTLMELAKSRSIATGKPEMRLEADAARESLLDWYQRLGFHRTALLHDFYAPGRHAWRMSAALTSAPVALRPFE